MKKFYISLVSIFLSIVVSVTLFFIIISNFEAKYRNTYYGELENKTERLDSINDKKIVFIGGSSLSFGIKSKELEEALGMPTVSYGLYASLGTKIMMELAYNSIHEGDIVILAPEISKDTYSTMMNYKNILKCFEGNDLYKRLDLNYQMEFLYNYPSFQLEKNKIEISEEKKPYTKDSFDTYGEIYDDLRINNIMQKYYDPSQEIKPSGDLFSDEFITYLNQYNDGVKAKGATLYFGYSPTNQKAFNDSDLENYNSIIEKRLNFESLGNIKDYIYNEYYFYDTNFHLNSAGAYLHTSKLAKNLSNKLNLEIKKEIEIKSMPSPLYTLGDEIELDSIIYTKSNNGYFVSDVLDTFKGTRLEIPKEIFGVKVIGVLDQAFSNLENLEELVLPESIESLGDECFYNSLKLTKIYLNSDNAPLVPSSGLFDNTNPDIKVYVPKAKLKLYTSGYTWMSYISYLKPY